MKTRESGMPDESMWAGFFDPPAVLVALGRSPACRDVAEFGCGYGTFTTAAANINSGVVYAFDIEPDMVRTTLSAANLAGRANVRAIERDFVAHGTGLPDSSVDYAMLFNILHAESPMTLLNEARRVLTPCGVLGIAHWNYDAKTPRGPSMKIRTRPERCMTWAEQAGFSALPPGVIDLPPYHYGIALRK